MLISTTAPSDGELALGVLHSSRHGGAVLRRYLRPGGLNFGVLPFQLRGIAIGLEDALDHVEIGVLILLFPLRERRIVGLRVLVRLRQRLQARAACASRAMTLVMVKRADGALRPRLER